MSSMLEQAIADAAALREQAIKNAEQSVLDKYSKQIKEAVDEMLEREDPTDLDKADKMIAEAEEELMQEEDAALGGESMSTENSVEAPLAAYDSRPEANDLMTRVFAVISDIETDADGNISLDLGDISQEEMDAADGAPEGDMGDLGDLGAPEPTAEPEGEIDSILGDLGGDTGDELDQQLQEVLNMLNEEKEEDQVEEQLTYDRNPCVPTGTPGVMDAPSKMNQEAANALDALGLEEEDEEEGESEDSTGVTNQLQETIEFLTQQNSKMEGVLSKMENYLEEALLSNAKLLYQNRTLSDASLNERQKSKIVEAISNAESPKEAKRLHETLKATVGSTPNSKKGPQSLSESVNRRSNLSSMLNSRQNIKESKQMDPFMEKMQKLAGIKK